MQIMDHRTLDIIQTYEFYKNSPEKAFPYLSQVWFDSVTILSRLEPKL